MTETALRLSHWKSMELQELANVERGKFSARPRNDSRYYGGEYPFVQTGDIACAKGTLHNFSQTLNEEGLKVSRLFPKGTILITIAANIGDVAIAGFDVACPDSLVAISPKKQVDTAWLLHSLMLQKKVLEGLATQNAQKNINLQVLRPMVINVPPFQEQQEIGSILHCWDQAIDLTERLIAAKQERRKWLMQQLLTSKRRLSGFIKPWKTVQIGDVLTEVARPVEMHDDKLYELVSVRRNWGGLFVRERLYGQYIKTKNLHEIRENDFLISHIQVAYGSLALVPKEYNGFKVSDLYTCLIPRSVDEFDMRFFAYLAQQPKMTYLARISSNGFFAERLRLNFKIESFLDQTIKIPPTIQEQQAIVHVLETADRELDLLRAQLNALREQKKGLMQQLLTGKVRVKISPAEATAEE